jgi:putative Ca2+/H+ antiporter (TMEM165/GDT1 family)
MQAFFVSTGLVALAEIGDKTQLLALVLAARFRAPLAIVAGIALATLANHALAGLAGTWIGGFLEGPWLGWGLGLSFLAVAVWALVPDKLDGKETGSAGRHGAFAATLVSFFLVEIGDKTQVATVALAAHYQAVAEVVVGTTLGMLLANVPAVLLGHSAAGRLPLKTIRVAAAATFAVLAVLALARG